MIIKRYCYAKINLYLRVLGKRPDGFHELETLFQEIDLADTLEFEPAPIGALQFSVSGAELGKPEDNLVCRAVKSYELTAKVKVSGYLRLAKRIPAGGGLGGGSSDAANTLLVLQEHFGNPLTEKQLSEVALELGSDVPFFLRGGCQLGRGRGERLTPANRPKSPSRGYVILPGIVMSTPSVFKAFAQGEKPDCEDLPELGENHLLSAALSVDPKFMHVYAKLVTIFRGETFFMTGSGSTCVWLTDSEMDQDTSEALATLKCRAIPFNFRDRS